MLLSHSSFFFLCVCPCPTVWVAAFFCLKILCTFPVGIRSGQHPFLPAFVTCAKCWKISACPWECCDLEGGGAKIGSPKLPEKNSDVSCNNTKHISVKGSIPKTLPLHKAEFRLLFHTVTFKVALNSGAWQRFLRVISFSCGYMIFWWIVVLDAVLSDGCENMSVQLRFALLPFMLWESSRLFK